MGLKLGNTTIGSLYLGSTKIAQAYLGSSLIYQATTPVVSYPYLLFQCDGYNNTHPAVSTIWSGASVRPVYNWTQVSYSPNIWKLEIAKWATIDNLGTGLLCLFSTQSSPPVGTISASCRLIGSGNMDVALNGTYCQSFDRMFANCPGLEYIEPIHCTTVQNVGGMFQGCTNVEEGALDQYNWFDTYGVNITNHSGTFTDCGADTTTGLDELDQIPVGWGGNMVPASTLMTSAVANLFSSNKSAWKITGNAPDWTNIVGMYLFTQSSVSQFAGVSMNRSRISARNGLGTGTGNALYFYPAFAQCTGTTASNRVITWLATTDIPNGNLTSRQGNTDMPGTLDYSTYGPITQTYGTYDSSLDVFFLFLVTNKPIDEDSLDPWGGLSDAYGVLYNAGFLTDGGFRYFF